MAKKYLSQFEKDGFTLVPGTVGIIINGVWFNRQRSELIVDSYKGTLVFKPMQEEEISKEWEYILNHE